MTALSLARSDVPDWKLSLLKDVILLEKLNLDHVEVKGESETRCLCTQYSVHCLQCLLMWQVVLHVLLF